MRSEILIVENISREGPGILQEILDEKNISYKIIDLNKNENLPDPEDFSAVVVLGGPDSANDKNLKMENELEFIKRTIDLGIPYLGICLGLQTLVKSAGGKVIKSPVKEIGFKDPSGKNFEVELTESGKKDLLFYGLGNKFKVFHLHGETVELTNEMTLLAEGNYCRNQIVKLGRNAYGLQCHFELTGQMLNQWLDEDADLKEMIRENLIKDYKKIKTEYENIGRKLFENFIKISGF